ncbi:hypothetical protein KXS07_31700 [Inquilinus limosus]|uniref:hypothetical protein n=1 Tax=Inquilinus limosus TaxID=171674 RepID=UPI003F1558A2
MVLLRHPRPAGFVALLMLGTVAAGPAFARTGLQSEHYPLPPQMAQADASDTQDSSAPSFDHGENGADRNTHPGEIGPDHGERGHDRGGGFGGGRGGDHGGGHGSGRGR